jgi:hypothetical protein
LGDTDCCKVRTHAGFHACKSMLRKQFSCLGCLL